MMNTGKEETKDVVKHYKKNRKKVKNWDKQKNKIIDNIIKKVKEAMKLLKNQN